MLAKHSRGEIDLLTFHYSSRAIPHGEKVIPVDLDSHACSEYACSEY